MEVLIYFIFLDSALNGDVTFVAWVLAKDLITWGTGFGLKPMPRLVGSDLSCQMPHHCPDLIEITGPLTYLFYLIFMVFSCSCFSTIFCDMVPTAYCDRFDLFLIAL